MTETVQILNRLKNGVGVVHRNAGIQQTLYGIVHNDERLLHTGKVRQILLVDLRAEQDHAAGCRALQQLRKIQGGKIVERRYKKIVSVAAAFLSGGIHDLCDEAGIAVDKIGVLAVFEKA